MTRTVAAVVTFAALTIGVACAESPTVAVYSKAEASSLIRRAHTAEQYRMLASYFKARQTSFEAQAQAEKQEWERLSQNTTGNSQKYPRPVDSSRNRYQYFTYKADQMGQQAKHFENLAAAAPQ
jgi:hypothetical protein